MPDNRAELPLTDTQILAQMVCATYPHPCGGEVHMEFVTEIAEGLYRQGVRPPGSVKQSEGDTIASLQPKLAAYETLLHKGQMVQESGGWHDKMAFNEWNRLVTLTHRDLCQALAKIIGERLVNAVLCIEGNGWSFEADAREHVKRSNAYLEGQRIKGDPLNETEQADGSAPK